jgi:hypothetical protein
MEGRDVANVTHTAMPRDMGVVAEGGEEETLPEEFLELSRGKLQGRDG